VSGTEIQLVESLILAFRLLAAVSDAENASFLALILAHG
jgi:hypothetical protein